MHQVQNPIHSYAKKTNPAPSIRKGSPLALLLLVLLFAAALAGCGSGNDNAANGASANAGGSSGTPAGAPAASEQASPSPASSGDEAQPLTVKHGYGETTIPAHPKRIVSLGMEDILLSLDVPMAQAFSTDGYYLEQQIKDKGIETNSSFEINLEKIASANPDLIIMNQYVTDEEGYKQLSKIAPTIAFVRDDWQATLASLGQALGKEEQAKAVLQAYRTKVEQAKVQIVQAVGENKTVAFIRPSTSQVELDFPEWSWTSALYNELGLKPDPKVLEFEKNSQDTWGGTMLSLEMLPELTADYLFMDYGSSLSAEADFQKAVAASAEVEKLSVWKSIPAVKQGNVFQVSARHWALSGPIAESMKIDDVVNAVTGKK